MLLLTKQHPPPELGTAQCFSLSTAASQRDVPSSCQPEGQKSALPELPAASRLCSGREEWGVSTRHFQGKSKNESMASRLNAPCLLIPDRLLTVHTTTVPKEGIFGLTRIDKSLKQHIELPFQWTLTGNKIPEPYHLVGLLMASVLYFETDPELVTQTHFNFSWPCNYLYSLRQTLLQYILISYFLKAIWDKVSFKITGSLGVKPK